EETACTERSGSDRVCISHGVARNRLHRGHSPGRQPAQECLQRRHLRVHPPHRRQHLCTGRVGRPSGYDGDVPTWSAVRAEGTQLELQVEPEPIALHVEPPLRGLNRTLANRQLRKNTIYSPAFLTYLCPFLSFG